MKIINWLKRNLLLIILVFIVILLSLIKLRANKQVAEITKPVIPTPTEILRPETEVKYNNKTKKEILEMDPEEGYDFITELDKNEVEKLDMMPNYDFSDFLPERKTTFVAEKYDPVKRELIVQPLITNKTEITDEVKNWLFYETGNNTKTIKIIWNE